MDFIGKVCPYCKTEFKEGDDVVVCSVCEMPHHKECWVENAACTTFGCTGTISGSEQQEEQETKPVFCTQCGAAMKEGQKFCSVCGTPNRMVENQQVAAVNAGYQQQNTYAAPQPQYASQPQAAPQPQYASQPQAAPQQQYASQPQAAPQQQYVPQPQVAPQQQYNAYQQNAGYNGFNQQQQYSEQDMMAFMQTNQNSYMFKFNKMQMSNSNVSWNWCAFLFGSFWFAYRKMYDIAAAYIGIVFVIGFMPTELAGILELALWVVGGLFGDYFYKRYVNNELFMSQNMDQYAKSMHFMKKGGTSVGAVFAVFGIMFVIALLFSGI